MDFYYAQRFKLSFQLCENIGWLIAYKNYLIKFMLKEKNTTEVIKINI